MGESLVSIHPSEVLPVRVEAEWAQNHHGQRTFKLWEGKQRKTIKVNGVMVTLITGFLFLSFFW
jgi:hypothetical protein